MRVLVCGSESGFPEEWLGVIKAEDNQVVFCPSGPDFCAGPGFEAELAATSPEAVFLDEAGSAENGLLPIIRMIVPSARIILWTDAISLEIALKAVSWGVCGVILSSTSAAAVQECLAKVRLGELWFDQALFEVSGLPGEQQEPLNFPVRGQGRLQTKRSGRVPHNSLNTYLAFLFHSQISAAKMND